MAKDLVREENREGDHDWSKLFPDLLRTILENSNLSFLDLQGAKTVCSDWYKVWRTCVKPPLYPWRIILQGESSMLFDPRGEKYYKTKDLGLDFCDDTYCLASSGNWLLLVDSGLNSYLLNVLTQKRINLPLVESSIRGGNVRFYRIHNGIVYVGNSGECVSRDTIKSNSSAVLSINQKTGDYFVAWMFKQKYLFTHKKGDDWWWNWNVKDIEIWDLAYKNNKLYMYTMDDHINILDVSSGYVPKEKNPYSDHPFYDVPLYWKRKIVITNSGEVLIILRVRFGTFYVFKMNLVSKKWERVKSIGDNEMLIFGHGVTIRAPVQDVGCGFKSDSICYVDVWPNDADDTPQSGVFDLATRKITWSEKWYLFRKDSMWFVPGLA